MMILRLDAAVTHAAMMRARGTPDVAALAVFGRHLHGAVADHGRFDDRPGGRRGPQRQRILVR